MDKFIDIVNGVKQLKTPIETSRGTTDAGKIVRTNSEGVLDETLLPATIGAESFLAVAGENISANDLVYSYDDNGTLKVKKAIATSFSTLAIGFVKNSASTGQSITVYTDGYFSASGVDTTKKDVYLSATTAGAWTQTPPTSGFLQIVGKALSPTSISFELGDIVQL